MLKKPVKGKIDSETKLENSKHYLKMQQEFPVFMKLHRAFTEKQIHWYAPDQ